MTTVEVRNAQGEVVAERELPSSLFEATVNVAVMHQVVVAGGAAQRSGTHATKTRGDVSGGGRKPWRQKGTGRARQGSTRAPHWTGGGVVHGPTPRDHSVRVNKKMRRAALRSALTDTSRSGKLAVIDALEFDGPRTKDAVAVLDALDLGGRILVVIARPEEAIERSFRNLRHVKVGYPGNLSTFDLLYADRVLFTAAALDLLAERLEEARSEDPDATRQPEGAEDPDTTEAPDSGEDLSPDEEGTGPDEEAPPEDDTGETEDVPEGVGP